MNDHKNKAISIMKKIEEKGFSAYIIGGAVRDTCLNIEPKDFDVFTDANGVEILEIFPEGNIIGGEIRQQKILTVIVDGTEVSQFRANGDRTETGRNLKKHLSTCDFTINAMAVDIDGKIIDYHNGQEDLKKKIIRAVGKPEDRIAEDKLRVMRAVRFASRFDFTIEKDLERVIKNTDIFDIPKERIREELFKTLRYENGIEILQKMDLLRKLLPELTRMKALKKHGIHHIESPFQHSIMSYKASCSVTDNILLRFVILMHDIGKYDTYSDEDSKVTFYHHNSVGAEQMEKIMNIMKFSKKEIEYAHFLITYHMLGYDGIPLKKTIRKLYRHMKQKEINYEDLITIQFCDTVGTVNGKEKPTFEEYKNTCPINKLFQEVINEKIPMSTSDLMINGNDLMTLGMKPSPEMGIMLKSLLEKVDSGEMMNNRDELLLEAKRTIEWKSGRVEEFIFKEVK